MNLKVITWNTKKNSEVLDLILESIDWQSVPCICWISEPPPRTELRKPTPNDDFEYILPSSTVKRHGFFVISKSHFTFDLSSWHFSGSRTFATMLTHGTIGDFLVVGCHFWDQKTMPRVEDYAVTLLKEMDLLREFPGILAEDRLFFGDFNFEPFDLRCVKREHVNATPYKVLAKLDRIPVQGSCRGEFPIYWNPTWMLFDDATNPKGVGTFRYDKAFALQWSNIDQVLCSGKFIDGFQSIAVIESFLHRPSKQVIQLLSDPGPRNKSFKINGIGTDHLPLEVSFDL